MGDSVPVMRSPCCCCSLQSSLTACAHHMHLDRRRYSAPAHQKILSDSRSSVTPCEHGSSVVDKRKKMKNYTVKSQLTSFLFVPFISTLRRIASHVSLVTTVFLRGSGRLQGNAGKGSSVWKVQTVLTPLLEIAAVDRVQKVPTFGDDLEFEYTNIRIMWSVVRIEVKSYKLERLKHTSELKLSADPAL